MKCHHIANLFSVVRNNTKTKECIQEFLPKTFSMRG